MNVAKWLLALLALLFVEPALLIAVGDSTGFLPNIAVGRIAGWRSGVSHACSNHVACIRVALGDGGHGAANRQS